MPRMPENPLPATLQYGQDGTVVAAPVQTDQLHLHRDDVQITHHHYAAPLPSTSAQIGVALANAFGQMAKGIGLAGGGGAVLLIGGQVIAVDVLAIGASALGIAIAANSVGKTITAARKPPEKPAPAAATPRKRRWI